MDEPYLLAAARYGHPVRAKLVRTPEEYPWSSACSCSGTRRRIGEGGTSRQLESGLARVLEQWHDGGRIGHPWPPRTTVPLGDDTFLRRLENRLGGVLRRLKPGPKTQGR